MPVVDGKRYPYTKEGIAAAKKAAAKKKGIQAKAKGASGSKKMSKPKLMAKAEEQRRGMASTRGRQQAARPSISQRRNMQMQRRAMEQDSMANSAVARRARERMRMGY